MPTDTLNTDIKHTGWFAVVHFGTPKDKQTLPCFLKRIPYKRTDGEWQLTYRHFTFNMEEAALFNNLSDAEGAKRIAVKRLTSSNHPLKDHIKVLQLLGRIRETEEETYDE